LVVVHFYLLEDSAMGILSKVFGIKQAVWRAVPDSERQVGPLSLHDNGDYGIGPMTFDQDCSFKDTNIGGAMVNKAAGPNQVLAIDAPRGLQFRLRYYEGQWQYLSY
jgi:hypothetical protein